MKEKLKKGKLPASVLGGESVPRTLDCYRYFPDLLSFDQHFEDERQICLPFSTQVADFDKWERLNQECRTMFEMLDPGGVTNFIESSGRLLAGTLNICNRLIEQARLRTPINTLVYLDKSGRLAAYLLNISWRAAEKTGYTFPIPKPKIRFINVGPTNRWNSPDPFCLNLLGHLYPSCDINRQHVMIVDEICSSGGSIRSAAQFLLSAGYRPRWLKGISQFAHTPGWYSRSRVKGVSDPISSESNLAKLVRRDPRLFDSVLALSEIISIRMLVELFQPETPPARLERQLTSHQRQKLITAGINLIDFKNRFEIKCRTVCFDQPDKVICTLLSYGNYIAFPPDLDDVPISTKYRQVLRYMVEKAFASGFIKIQ